MVNRNELESWLHSSLPLCERGGFKLHKPTNTRQMGFLGLNGNFPWTSKGNFSVDTSRKLHYFLTRKRGFLMKIVNITISCLLVTFFAVNTVAFAEAILEINPSNLKSYSLMIDENDVDDHWKTTVVVDANTYVLSGSGGSQSTLTMMDALDEVVKSPYSATCVLSEQCYGGQCTKTYGIRQINRVIKILVDGKNNITRFIPTGTISACQ